ncbi:hypothetical protein A9Q81_21110 [Gammaproteobacteria bacterium 42_54_T18]|mgnify:CR=1 FL=1|nr:hypothetical protein A9Q81_21110 [Gammaproteobacteria bacterium 42_54_T18]
MQNRPLIGNNNILFTIALLLITFLRNVNVPKLFDFSNEGFTNMRYKKGQAINSTAEGWCFGYSLNWRGQLPLSSAHIKH